MSLKLGGQIIYEEQIVYKTGKLFAFVPHIRILPGHLLLCPKDEKYTRYTELPSELLFEIAIATQMLTKVVEEVKGMTLN